MLTYYVCKINANLKLFIKQTKVFCEKKGEVPGLSAIKIPRT